MRSRIIVVVIAFGMLFGAGIASASEETSDSRVDTLFSYGYDPQAQLFFTATHATDSSAHDCTLDGTVTATYGDDIDGSVPITDLADEQGAIIFDPTGHELAEDVELAGGWVEYSADGPCGISGIAVGTNGHINHGQFMKLFNAQVDMRGRGCLNRWLAKSGLGKDEQHIKTMDFAADGEIATQGTIEFTTVLASCEHGNKDKSESHPAGSRQKEEGNRGEGRPDKPGKSDQAPGRNR